MLDFAYQYRKAVNKITDIRDMKLRAYEIEAHKWEVVRQLRDLLKVSILSILFQMSGSTISICFLDFQGRHIVLLTWRHT